MPVLLSVQECDDALSRALKVPEEDRGALWSAIVDELLDRRAALAGVEANLRDIRVMRARELR